MCTQMEPQITLNGPRIVLVLFGASKVALGAYEYMQIRHRKPLLSMGPQVRDNKKGKGFSVGCALQVAALGRVCTRHTW